MSLVVSLEILGATQEELKALGADLPSQGNLSLRPQKDGLFFWKWKGFVVDGLDDALPSNASTKSDYWSFTGETNKDLEKLLAAFYQKAPRRFYLYAAFSGDLPKRDSEVDMAEILEIVGGGHLGNRVRYLVRPATPKIIPSEEASS